MSGGRMALEHVSPGACAGHPHSIFRFIDVGRHTDKPNEQAASFARRAGRVPQVPALVTEVLARHAVMELVAAVGAQSDVDLAVSDSRGIGHHVLYDR